MSDEPEDIVEVHFERYVRSEFLGQGAIVRKLPRRSSSKGADHPRDPKVFAANLQGLFRSSEKSHVEVVARSEVSRRWYKRLMTHGIERIDKRTRPSLEALAQLFGLKQIEDLWDPDLDRLRPRAGLDEQILAWSTKVNWPYAKKLLELLETGEHEYLRGLIDSLHALEVRKGLGDAGAALGADRPEDRGEPASIRQRVRRRPKKAGRASQVNSEN